MEHFNHANNVLQSIPSVFQLRHISVRTILYMWYLESYSILLRNCTFSTQLALLLEFVVTFGQTRLHVRSQYIYQNFSTVSDMRYYTFQKEGHLSPQICRRRAVAVSHTEVQYKQIVSC